MILDVLLDLCFDIRRKVLNRLGENALDTFWQRRRGEAPQLSLGLYLCGLLRSSGNGLYLCFLRLNLNINVYNRGKLKKVLYREITFNVPLHLLTQSPKISVRRVYVRGELVNLLGKLHPLCPNDNAVRVTPVIVGYVVARIDILVNKL